MPSHICFAALTICREDPALVIADSAPPLMCQVQEDFVAGVARVWLRVRASGPATGQYSISVSKRDTSGNANLRQGGAFTFQQVGFQDLGLITVSVDLGGTLQASGSVNVDGIIIQCNNQRVEKL